MGFHPANFALPVFPFSSWIEQRDRQTGGRTGGRTDGQTDTGHHFTMPFPYRGREIR